MTKKGAFLMKNLFVLSFFLFVAAAAFAQEEPVDNIGHARHKFKHGEALPTEPASEARFSTTRISEIQRKLPKEEKSFTFVVFGDRTGGAVKDVSVLADAVRETNLLEPDLVFNVGDMVNGYNTTPLWLEQAKEYRGIMDELHCPWFPVTGNHDLYWRGADKPKTEHESDYEKHVAPLWYAFEHKNCWFIALCSDEGNPKTGEKDFSKPECQKMSDAQFSWLKSVLAKAKNADHVFVFLHQPRWARVESYGDDWDKVHAELVKAGNVAAVFAGHIHRMRSDPKDGIEYLTLATTGGGQGFEVPRAGFLHHFDQVVVRKNRVAYSTIPVGSLIDPREITDSLQQEIVALKRQVPQFEKGLPLKPDGSCDSTDKITVMNTASFPAEWTLFLQSDDSRWDVSVTPKQAVIKPGETCEFEQRIRRSANSLDAALRPVYLKRQIVCLTPGSRIEIPEVVTEIPLDLSAFPAPDPKSQQKILHVGGNGAALKIPDGAFSLPNGPMTVETWFRADKFDDRTGLATKTENSDYGIFVSNGVPHFSIFLGSNYVSATAKNVKLDTDRWYHVAGVYDGKEIRLYLDGKLMERKDGTGKRRTNRLPLYLGGDVDKDGGVTSCFVGDLDSFRLSKSARYDGESFQPQRDFVPDKETVLLFDMQRKVGVWVPNAVDPKNTATLVGGATVSP